MKRTTEEDAIFIEVFTNLISRPFHGLQDNLAHYPSDESLGYFQPSAFADFCAKPARGILKSMTAVQTSFIATLFLLPLLSATSHGQQQLDRDDTQEWTELQFYAPVTKKVDFVVGGVLRIGRDFSRPVDERIGAGFSFRLGKYLTVSPNYLHIGTQPFKGRLVFENRLSVPTLIKFSVGNYTISDRNLFERRLRHPGIDATRYRNKLQIEHPIGPDRLKLSAFIANEVFYDWSFNAWVRNRFQVGMIHPFNKHVSADFYYLRQNDSHSIPGDLHVIGSTWRFRL